MSPQVIHSRSRHLPLLTFLMVSIVGTLLVWKSGISAPARSHTIRGVVLSSGGQAISQARVKIPATSESTLTDKSGRFKLDTRSSGVVTLVTTAQGYRANKRRVKLTQRFVNVVITLKKKDQPAKIKSESRAAAGSAYSSSGGGGSGGLSFKGLGLGGDGGSAGFGLGSASSVSKMGGRAKGRSGRRVKRRPRLARARRPAPSPAGFATHTHSSLSIASDTASREDAGQDEYEKITENDYKDPKSSPLSTFSIDVDTASYANLRRFIQNRRLPPKDSVKIEEMINYFTYQYEAPKARDPHPFNVRTELAETPWNAKHKLLHIGLQGRRIDAAKLPPSNLVFLLDVSGSMRGADRLPLLKQALTLLSGTLRPQDKVSIVVYAGAAGVVLPPTSGSERRTIIEAFSKLSAGGSTAGGAGIKVAYDLAQKSFIKGGNNRVILATDGDFNVGTSSQAELVRLIEEKRKSGVFLTVLGFGRGNYRAATMSQLAERGNGNHAYIDSILEAQKVLVSEMGGTLFTIAKDVKIQVEFNPNKVESYRLIGYQSRVLAARDFNDDKKDAGELGAGHSVTALYEIIPAGTNSNASGSVDQLKYQQKGKTNESDEWLTVKLRYKKPDGDKSTLLTHPHKRDRGDWREASEDFRFSAGIAQFGMLLRDSKHLIEGSAAERWTHTQGLLSGATGEDDHGYRAELLDLVKRARALKLR